MQTKLYVEGWCTPSRREWKPWSELVENNWERPIMNENRYEEMLWKVLDLMILSMFTLNVIYDLKVFEFWKFAFMKWILHILRAVFIY